MKMDIMNGKHRFYVSLAILQVILVVSAILIVNSLIGSVKAADETSNVDPATSMILAISAAVSIVGATIAAGSVIKSVGTAAISALTEREDVFFKAFLVIALGEALAIYGLIVAILLWIKIPDF
ncbi:MAG: hypothetical protein GF364_11605 [Candidatus Lokiarchaeota archaeon]|nr:hypothetical protein [Candidatus Lokiarchaeota archaeon]